MATIYNSDLTKELIEAGKLQVSRDKIPSEIAEKVVPVIDVNPKHNRIINVGRMNNGTGTITVYTTPTDQDFYICSCSLSCIKAAADTGTYQFLSTTEPGGQTVYLCSLSGVTLTAEQKHITVSFPFPIKVKRGETILAQNAAGTIAHISATVQGFLVENINA
jgi:hypothetical protein